MHLLGALQFSNLLRHGGKATDALISLDGIADALENILSDKSFKDLEVPLALTALDMLTGHEIILREGRLLDAVLATIAIPGIFPIQKMNGYELVDGGLSNPVPIAIARSLSPYSPVIACVLSQSLQQASSANGNGAKPNVVSSLPLPGALMRFRFGRSFAAFMNALAVSGRVQTELRIGFEKPDILIRPSVEEIGLLENVDVADLVTRGERATEIVMPDIKRALRRARWSMMVPRKTGRAS
jgi:NTE family protein